MTTLSMVPFAGLDTGKLCGLLTIDWELQELPFLHEALLKATVAIHRANVAARTNDKNKYERGLQIVLYVPSCGITHVS
jgi:hypothetical protein